MAPGDVDALPAGARLRLGTTRFRPGLGALAPVFSPDGERMLVEDGAGRPRLHLVETRTGRHLETLPSLSDDAGRTLALSWTAAGIRVACQLFDGKPAILEYASRRVRRLESPDAPGADEAAFSADGTHVAMVDHQGALRVWNTGSGRQLARARPLTGSLGVFGLRKAVALSAEGRLAAWSLGDSRIHLHDVGARRPRPSLQGHQETVAWLAFSPDGTRLASTALTNEPCLRLWDVESGAALPELPVPDASRPAFTFLGAGARLAWLEGPRLRTRELHAGASTSREVGRVQTHAPLSASPDGAWVVAREGHALRVWNLETGAPEPVHSGHSRPVRTVALSPDSTLAATSDNEGEVHLWELASGRSQARFELTAAPGCLRFSPEGRWLAVGTADGRLHLASPTEGRVIHTLPVHPSRLSALAFAPEGREVATCGEEGGDLSVWSVPDGERLRVLSSGLTHPTALDYSPDGQWLVASGMDGTLCFFRARDGHLVHRVRAPDASVHRLRFFPDGQRLLSVGLLDSDFPDDGPGQAVLHLWRVDSGQLLTSRRVRALQLEPTPEGRLLRSVSSRDPALWEEDALTGEAPRPLLPVPEPLCHAFSADHGVWVTGHEDCTALVWDTGRPGVFPDAAGG